MYKLVVLFSVVVLAAAKPGLVAPLTYGAVPALSSVSQYSSSVLHGSPVVGPSVYSAGPAVYSAGPAVYSGLGGLPAVYGGVPSVYNGLVSPAVVSGVALSQAPHSPAVVLDAVNGVPLDTPEVVAARAAHFQAKALSAHHLRKRSVPLSYSSVVSGPVVSAYSTPVVSSPVVSAYSTPVVSAYSAPVVSAYSSPVLSGYSSPVVSYSSPALVGSHLGYSAAVVPRALSVHPY